MAATFHEIIVKGDAKTLKGFIRGIQVGGALKRGLYIGGESPIAAEHLKHLHVGHGKQTHIICTVPVRKRILDSIAAAADLGLEIVFDEEIFRTYFEFEFETFNRDVAKAIKGCLKRLPAGLRLVDYEPDETVDQSARGVELYSPTHDYRFAGKGKLDGDIDSLLAFREAIAANEFVTVGEVRIEHAS